MAVWRHFEDASLEEREGMVSWWWTARLNIEREPVTFTGKMGRSQRDVVDRYKNLMIRSLDQPLLTLEGLEAVITWERTIIHDERWKRLYHSFYLSGEWRNFRLRWLQTHSPCVRCDRTCEGLRLRHTNRPPFSHTVLDEGFLRVIQHPERFRIKCRDPRKEHAFLIEARKRAVSDKIAARPHVYSGNLTSKGGTHSVQVVSRDGVDRQHNTATQVSREEVQVDIVNVVASVILKHGLDLSSITLAFPTVEYRPNVFPGLILRLKEPKTATLIFRTGKMVCTGAKSERLARRAIHKVLRELKAKDIHIRGRPEITIPVSYTHLTLPTTPYV